MTDSLDKNSLVGTWEAPGQPPVVVTDDGNRGDGTYGPWVTWRFPWNTKTVDVLRWTFQDMIDKGGYKLVGP